jgi:hypothetical protein
MVLNELLCTGRLWWFKDNPEVLDGDEGASKSKALDEE